ncbi:hypothetical protein [uncultured Thiodictyon sp.]|uniref:hypothetical protein n=1 Tax=uncultured Thiodictyon sp. TaxID=1846217 RepID=UPI0025E6B4A0|nr:hypothetical protein [uncultured Thiodictyon sp.]
MQHINTIRTPLATLIALAVAAPGIAFAYGDKEAISDCENRIRSEYKLTDLRDATATHVMDNAEHHYKVQGSTKVDGDRHPWSCEVKNRHVTTAEYNGPKPKGLTTTQTAALGAAALIGGGMAINAMNKPATTTSHTPAPSGGSNANLPYRCQIYTGKTLSYEQRCSYTQRQGAVHIVLADSGEFSFSPVGNKPGTYINDGTKEKVIRKSGLGSKGVIYQLPSQSIHILY